jgi:2,3-dihydroxy-2,3-dihydro-p-cumate dehydrogenase
MTPAGRRVAIVTGAARGIGAGIAQRLAADGLRVVLADANEDVMRVPGELPGGEHLAWCGDLSTEEGAQALADAAMQHCGRIDVLVNNAGGGIIRSFLEHDAASLRETLARNLWTALWCCHKVLPHMVRQKSGRIVSIGGDSVRSGIPDHAGYNAAKGGVHAMTSALAREFAPHGITVNTVAPCVVETQQLRKLKSERPEYAAKFFSVVPLGRGAQVEEVAGMVAYLVGPDGGFVTGQTLYLNGGSTMP